jgi:hypothetical protein
LHCARSAACSWGSTSSTGNRVASDMRR